MIPSKEEWDNALAMRHGKDLQEKFSKAVVAVCGLGGLGSNISIALARAGIGRLILIDFDTVDVTNLHRQQYKASQIGRSKTEAIRDNLKEIAPYTDAQIHTSRITEDNAGELLKDADIVCEAFDNAESKAMIANYVLENMPGKYLVAASGMAGIDEADLIRTRKITDRFYLCGDGKSEVGRTEGLFASRVMVCAAHQAHTVLRIIAGKNHLL